MADAKIVVGADATAVERAMAAAKGSVKGAATGMSDAFTSAARSAISDLSNVAVAAGRVNFAGQHQAVKDFEMATARLAVSSGQNLERLRAGFEATGAAIGKRPGEVAAWASEVGKLTYNFAGAGEAIRGVAGLAAETGRSVADYRGLAVELGTVGNVAGDTSKVLGVMRAQAKEMGTQGGVAAFVDQIQSLNDVIGRLNMTAPDALARVSGAAAVLGKGLGNAASQRVQQQALSFVSNNIQGLERYLGHEVTDDKGQVTAENAVKYLQEYRDRTMKQYGGDKSKVRKVMANTLGSYETAAAVMNSDFDKAAELTGLRPAATTAQTALNKTDAGGRAVAEATLDASSRALMGSSTLLGNAANTLQTFAASNPFTSTIVATALSTGIASVLKGVSGKALGGLLGGAAEGGGALGLGAVAAPLAIGTAVAGAGVYGIKKFEGAAEERHALEEKERDSIAESALHRNVASIRRSNTKAAGVRANAGIFGALGLDTGLGGVTGGDVAKVGDMSQLTKAVEAGLKSGIRITVSSSVGAVDATVEGANSPAAGHQG